MNLGTVAAVIAGALASPMALEAFRAWRDRHKADVETDLAALNFFYPTWKEEMQRLHSELAQLRAMVERLSDEVRRLGGDPHSIIYTPPQEQDQ